MMTSWSAMHSRVISPSRGTLKTGSSILTRPGAVCLFPRSCSILAMVTGNRSFLPCPLVLKRNRGRSGYLQRFAQEAKFRTGGCYNKVKTAGLYTFIPRSLIFLTASRESGVISDACSKWVKRQFPAFPIHGYFLNISKEAFIDPERKSDRNPRADPDPFDVLNAGDFADSASPDSHFFRVRGSPPVMRIL